MRILIRLSLLLLTSFLLLPTAWAQFEICNKSGANVTTALGEYKNGNWVTNGWWSIESDQCAVAVAEDLPNRYYYFYGKRNDGVEWMGEASSAWFCTQSTVMNDLSNSGCTESIKPFMQIDTGDASYYTLNLTNDNARQSAPSTRTGGLSSVAISEGVIDEQCLFTWEDSHQIHSEELIIEFNYQAMKTTMKKLEHCLRLTTTGPIEIGDLGQQYVQSCIDYSVNDDANLYLLEAIVAIGIDVLSAGATGGSATAAVVTAYVTGVGNKMVDCLTDTDRIQRDLGEVLLAKFNAKIEEESHWVYWEL